MSNRLISLLSDIEQAILANDPAPDGGKWATSRLINFHQGLARLNLTVQTAAGAIVPRGTVLLQHFTLADETQCLKANLAWPGVGHPLTCAIYAKPDVDWKREAGLIAAKWLDGQPTLAPVVEHEPAHALAEAMA